MSTVLGGNIMNIEEENMNNSNIIETQLPKERTLDVFEDIKNMKNYSFVQNNKKILEPRKPSQNDLEKFEEWKKKKLENTSNKIKSDIFRIIIIVILCIYLALNSQSLPWTILLPEISSFIFLLVFLVLLPLYDNIKEYLDIPSWEIEHCNYVQVVDKYKVWAKRITRCLIISINEKHLIFTDDFSYPSVNIGDEVMLFNVKGKNTVYFCKKD